MTKLEIGLDIASSQGGGFQAFTLFQAGNFSPVAFGNNTEVIVIDTSALNGGVPGFNVTHFRISVQGSIDRMYIGISAGGGSQDDSAVTLVPILFNGSQALSQSNSSVVISDPVEFPWNKTDDLIFSFEFQSQDAPFINGTDADAFAFYGGYGEADIEDKVGYSFLGQQITHIKKIEALG